jgi:hypothetical protein
VNESEGSVGGGEGETHGRQKDPGESAIAGVFLGEQMSLAFFVGEDRSTLGRTAAGGISGFCLVGSKTSNQGVSQQ